MSMRFKAFSQRTKSKLGKIIDRNHFVVQGNICNWNYVVPIPCDTRASARSLAHFLNQWDKINNGGDK